MSTFTSRLISRYKPVIRVSEPCWMHCCNGLDPRRDGGMVPSILGMTGALARGWGSIPILTPTPSNLGESPIPNDVHIFGAEADLEGSVQEADVVHFHGLWQGHTRRGCKAARQANVPYVVAAHGMAEPWALRHKALKKKVYTSLVEGTNLKRASCLHALSRPEIGHLRRLAPRAVVGFVPNGVDLEPFDDLPERSVLEDEFPELIGKFLLLFFGRLHAKKGLNLLAEAAAGLRRDFPELQLLIAGNDDGALAPLLEQAEALGIRRMITYVGHVSGERARQVWAAADGFVLPSYSEGFSMAILEALACRLPAVITTACHFPELARAGGGIEVEPNAAAVTEGIRALLEHSPAERTLLGFRGRALVERNYTWDRQAGRLAGIYEWVVGGGPAPEAVEDARPA
jgi:glycosyltransferase involved in cell wall biosynthesis